MGLENEIELFLQQKAKGIPWILGIRTGFIESFDEVPDVEVLRGILLQISALEEAVLWLAAAIDAGHHEPS